MTPNQRAMLKHGLELTKSVKSAFNTFSDSCLAERVTSKEISAELSYQLASWFANSIAHSTDMDSKAAGEMVTLMINRARAGHQFGMLGDDDETSTVH